MPPPCAGSFSCTRWTPYHIGALRCLISPSCSFGAGLLPQAFWLLPATLCCLPTVCWKCSAWCTHNCSIFSVLKGPRNVTYHKRLRQLKEVKCINSLAQCLVHGRSPKTVAIVMTTLLYLVLLKILSVLKTQLMGSESLGNFSKVALLFSVKVGA